MAAPPGPHDTHTTFSDLSATCRPRAVNPPELLLKLASRGETDGQGALILAMPLIFGLRNVEQLYMFYSSLCKEVDSKPELNIEY